MAAGSRTNAAAPPPISGRSGAAADATMRRGARLLAEFRRRVTPRPARGLLYSTASMVAALDAPSKARGLHWEATVVLGAWIGADFVEWFCSATSSIQELVCIDILACSLFCIRIFIDSSTGVSTYDNCFRSARVTYGSPWSCGSTIGPRFAQVAIYHPQQ